MRCNNRYYNIITWKQLISLFKGTNLQRVPESDYSVTVGGQPCTELDVSEDGTAITCLPPQSVSIFGQANLAVTVSMFVFITCSSLLC